MARLIYTVKNVNTGSVIYSGTKATGDYQELYLKLKRTLNEILDNKVFGDHVYGDRDYLYGRRKGSNNAIPKQAYGVPYITYKEGSILYKYSLLK